MVVFRDNKCYDEEIKTWQLWHRRQHTYKQRILEVDSKNSLGIIGQVEEVSHNAVQFCWNPNEHASAKVGGKRHRAILLENLNRYFRSPSLFNVSPQISLLRKV